MQIILTNPGGGGGGGGADGDDGAGYLATSTTSLLIAVASKAFTTQAGLAYTPGARVRASSAADTANYMEGLVASYSGTTLTVTVDLVGGSGTHADWNINVAGNPGATGATGATGDDGDDGDDGAAGATGATGPGYAATSTTSLLIEVASKVFTTQAGLAYSAGARARASSAANSANYMEGLVASYSGTTLTITVDLIGGSGTLNDWNINLAGDPGAAGAAGDDGDDGAAGAAGREAGIKYTYSSTTASADPGSGTLRFNHATLASATALYISETDGDSNAIAAQLATWDDSTSTIKGVLTVVKDGAPANLAVFNITGTLTDNGTWDTFTVANVVSSGTIADTDVVKLHFSRTGNTGATGATGASGGSAPGFRWGYTWARSGVDTVNDVFVTTGTCRDNDNNVDMVLQTGLMKRLDATWAVGTNAGGLDTGARANNTWYYIYVIKETAGSGTVDVLLSTQSAGVSVTMPSGYSYRRMIGAIRTGSSELDDLQAYYLGNEIFAVYNNPAGNGLDIDVTNQSTSSIGYALPRLPFNGSEAGLYPGLMNVHCNVSIDHASTQTIVYFRGSATGNSAPSLTASPLASIKMQTATDSNEETMWLPMQVGSQHMTARSNNTSTTLKLQVLGFTWPQSVT